MGAPDLIPIFGLGLQQKSRPATSQLRQNLYLELQKEPDRSVITAYGTPGLELFTNFGDTPVRGVIAPKTSDYVYFCHRGTFWQVDNAGTQTARGTIGTTSGKVSMAADGRYIGLVDGSLGYSYDMDNPATPIAEITDAQFPDGATTIDWLANYFIVELDNDYYISDIGSITAWSGDFASPESDPDPIVRVKADHQTLTLFGSGTIEFHGHTGNPDFPFQPIKDAALEWGLAAKHSLARVADALCGLFQGKQGEIIAGVMQGMRIDPISDHEMGAKFASFSTISDAVGYGYMIDAHPMYVVSFPTAGETWMCDLSNRSWTKLLSYGLTRHRGELGFSYLGKNYVTDYTNGKVYRLKPDVYTDNGDAIIRKIIGKHLFSGTGRTRVNAFQLDIETGVGLATGQGENPQAMLRVSRDGGRTWGPERWSGFGKVGEYTKRCIWRQCGRGRNFTFEVSISDPVKVAILGAGIAAGGGK